ncbi:2-C-methyl-D-erythritol 4-phosphate cytidylyltransferase [Anaerovibrio sp. JC8]|uniref:2-C-methyl-D-erythritol 4-phosphate cytidylyltransferase n=1 Tax=Anaerovibrio sp. JC8 TaxID=1240085 RepID=UPI000A09C4DF|nr:2-C-methyl-D-erythritol 4-phosphate cytidylyltransferase [Anaerovibrio sp. JC8]ORT99480.1 2-C-methyl-D-erythritol 4-phosphate cytidylyltransferase [Anaerovibrio sp. JC8]
MVTVIFPAAGKGSRMQAGMNKVFMPLDGVPILIRTLLQYSGCGEIDQMVVVVASHEVDFVKSILGKIKGLKPYKVVAGGSERQYSVLNGIKSIDGNDEDIILVHDAARPFISLETIAATISKVRTSGGAIAAVPAKNTIKVCDSRGQVLETPDRSALWEIQTPQGFTRGLLLAANDKAQADGFLGTDDASLVERTGQPVHIVNSDYRNIKITTPEDILIGEAFIKAQGATPLIEENRPVMAEINELIRNYWQKENA